MCYIDKQIVNKAEAIIANLTNDRKLFTAFDVTKLLRAEGIPNLPKHYELKNIVHDMFRDARMNRDYIRTQVHVNGAIQPSAFVYHPYDVDAEDYDADAIMPTNPCTQVFVPVQPVTATVAPSASAQGKISNRNTNVKAGTGVADSRGRIHVPSSYLSKIGATAYDDVFVQNLGSVIHIFKNPQPNMPGKNMSVDMYTNLKVAVGNKNAGSKYRFILNPAVGQITIAP